MTDQKINDMELPVNSFNEILKALSDQNYLDTKPESISKINVKLQDIQDAHTRIKNHILLTPVIESKYVGKNFCKVFLKCEHLQNTGSFKARGACNVLMSMSSSDRSRGCTISGGRNFMYAMSQYGLCHSVPMNLVVPKDCPLEDRQRFKENFAIVRVNGNDVNDASINALNYCDQIGTNYVHGSDRVDLIAGYGTLGLELLSQLDRMDAVICPVGSGGLAASLVLGIKTLKPRCLIYGVECASCPAMSRAFQEQKPTMINPSITVADSLSCYIASNNAFHVLKGYLDKLVNLVIETSGMEHARDLEKKLLKDYPNSQLIMV